MNRRDTGWFKSSSSLASNDQCVEVRLTTAAVGVRDSKDPLGSAFWVRPATWTAFVSQLSRG